MPDIVKFIRQLGHDLRNHLNAAELQAAYLAEINAIHPFREGNGRTQREFIRQLAVRNGYALNWSRVSREHMIEASRQSFRGDNAGLEQLLQAALDNEHNQRE